jgi:putative transcriptional regulator
MTRKNTEESRILRELLETAEELSAYGVVSKSDVAKVRTLCAAPPDYTAERVVNVRTRIAKMSQAVFASFLNVSVSTVQKWESPSANKHPSGTAAKLLHLVETKGIDVLMA